jgi:anti-sigma factor RsiW
MNCEEARELVTGLVDNEISDPERSSIESHLKDCARCRRAYEQERDIKSEIHNLAAEITAPVELQNKILGDHGMPPNKGELPRPWRDLLSFRPLGRPVFAFALVVIVLLPAIYFFTPRSQPVSLAALQVQRKIAGGEITLRTATNQSEIRSWQIHAVKGKFAPMEYDLAALRLWPIGGLVQDIDGRKMLVTVYGGAGQSVTCFTFLGKENDAPQDATVVFDQSRRINFYLFSRNGHNAVLHREGNVICLLVSSEMPVQELLDIIRSRPHKT